MKKITNCFSICLVAIILASSLCTTASAESQGEASLDVFVSSEGDVNASFNATAGGDVNYWIDGIEVKGEFNDIWLMIQFLKDYLDDTDDAVEDVRAFAQNIYGFASENNIKILSNKENLTEAFKRIQDNNNSIMRLLFEILAFENAYMVFKNETHFNMTGIKNVLEDHQSRISDLEEEIDSLFASIRNIGMGLAGLGLVAGAVVVNRRYSFKDMMNRNLNKFTSSKSGKAKKAKKLRVNPNRSPLKLLLNHFKV